MGSKARYILEVVNEWCTIPKFKESVGDVVSRRIQLDLVEGNNPAHTLFDETVKNPFHFSEGILSITKTDPELVDIQYVYLGSGGHSCPCRRNHIVAYYSWKIPATKKNRALLEGFDGLTLVYGRQFRTGQQKVVDAVVEERVRYEKLEAEEKAAVQKGEQA